MTATASPKPFKPGSVVEIDGVAYLVFSDAPGGVWAIPAELDGATFWDDVVLLGRPTKAAPEGRVKSADGAELQLRVAVAEKLRSGAVVVKGKSPTVHAPLHRHYDTTARSWVELPAAELPGEDVELDGVTVAAMARDLVHEGRYRPGMAGRVVHVCSCAWDLANYRELAELAAA